MPPGSWSGLRSAAEVRTENSRSSTKGSCTGSPVVPGTVTDSNQGPSVAHLAVFDRRSSVEASL